jgi:hypothetical protein
MRDHELAVAFEGLLDVAHAVAEKQRSAISSRLRAGARVFPLKQRLRLTRRILPCRCGHAGDRGDQLAAAASDHQGLGATDDPGSLPGGA